MSTNCKFEVDAVAGQDFVFMVRRDDDDGVLVDYTDWTARYVARESIADDVDLFIYTEADYVEYGAWDLVIDGETLVHNIKVTIPADKTLELQDAGVTHFTVGLCLYPPSTDTVSSPAQVLANGFVTLTHVVAN